MLESYYINSLQDGTVVNPVNLRGIMKNLKIVRVTESSVLVDGWQRGDEGDWSHFRGYIAPTVRVTISDDEPEENVEPRTNVEKVSGGSRGRPKVSAIEIIYPAKFTIKDLIGKYPEIGKPKLYIAVKNGVSEGKIKKVGAIKNKKGKDSSIFELVK